MSRITRAAAIAAVLFVASPLSADGQVELCEEAERFVRELVGMVAVSEPDTIDDWRTKAIVEGCRVTAAGATQRSPTDNVRLFYEVLGESGWVRTPDPRDAPNEGALRFRRDGADCLFNYYDSSVSLDTEAELMVINAVPLRSGERIFNFLVRCTHAAPAAPMGTELSVW